MCDFIGQSKDVTTQEEDCNPEQDPRQSADNASPLPSGTGNANNPGEANSITPSEEANCLGFRLLYQILHARIQQDRCFEHHTTYSRLLTLLKEAVQSEPRKIDTVKAVYTMALIEVIIIPNFISMAN